MQYRRFGRLDWKGSALGFGAMRLPTLNNNYGQIDEPEAARMLHYAIEHGVNYVDTAVHYHRGNSENFLGRALKGGYREKVKLITKLFPPNVNQLQDFDEQLNVQLKKLQTDHVDFYLLHGINHTWWPKMFELGVLEWAENAIADGRIGHLGFSFHDEYPVFKEIVDAYDSWSMCMFQYNYMHKQYQAGAKGLQYAASKGLAVVAMEPLLGGLLARPPQPIQALLKQAPRTLTPASWALRWIWNHPEISIVLSGMSTFQQVEENIADACNADGLTEEELALIDQVNQEYRKLIPIPCTDCKYCLPCPNGVDIPYNFTVYNNGSIYEKEDPRQARGWYWHMANAKGFEGEYHCRGRADQCNGCRACEEQCPQHIPISEWLPIVHQVLGEENAYDACPRPDGLQQ